MRWPLSPPRTLARDLKRRILRAFTDGVRHRPETTFGTVNADVLAHARQFVRPRRFRRHHPQQHLARIAGTHGWRRNSAAAPRLSGPPPSCWLAWSSRSCLPPNGPRTFCVRRSTTKRKPRRSCKSQRRRAATHPPRAQALPPSAGNRPPPRSRPARHRFADTSGRGAKSGRRGAHAAAAECRSWSASGQHCSQPRSRAGTRRDGPAVP